MKLPVFLSSVIFDVDGTLIDSNDAHAKAWAESLEKFGFPVSVEKIRPLIGMGGDKLLPELVGLTDDSEIGSRITSARSEIFLRKYLPTVRPFPYVRELILKLRSDGFDLAIASSAQENELGALLKCAGVADLFPTVTSSDDAEQSKPSPEIVKAALARLKVHPEQAAMVGDTPYDIAAARGAGVLPIGVLSGGWDKVALEGAVKVYRSPQDLLAHYETSPFALKNVA